MTAERLYECRHCAGRESSQLPPDHHSTHGGSADRRMGVCVIDRKPCVRLAAPATPLALLLVRALRGMHHALHQATQVLITLL